MAKKTGNTLLGLLFCGFFVLFVWMCMSYDKHVRLLEEYEAKIANYERIIEEYKDYRYRVEHNGESVEEFRARYRNSDDSTKEAILDSMLNSIHTKVKIIDPE